MDINVLNGLVRDILISEGKYNLYRNKVVKSKKKYNRL